MKILIVGGVAGGATAATRLRRLSEENEVIIFETEGKFAETLRFTKTPQYGLVETSLYER